MKNNILKQVKDSIAAAMTGRTVEQMEDDARQAAVKNAVDDYLIRNPDWKPSAKPVTNTKQKNARIKKALGAGAGTFTPHIVDEEVLSRACEAARAFQAADPERYGDIITAAPIKAG